MDKKKKVLIIALIICLIAAVASLSTVLILKNKTASSGGKTTLSADAGSTDESQGAVKSEAELVPEEYKKEYEDITSYGIKANPDLQVRAALFAYAKEIDGSVKFIEFDLLKTYDAFRIYDITYYSDNVEGDGKASAILPVYMDGGSALALEGKYYSTAEEKADYLTAYIQKLDSDYEKIVSEFKKSGEYLKLF